MQQLEEIISNPKVIVIRSVRGNDLAIVTATRVPFGDIRLEEWGWILSISHKNNHSQDGLEELSGRNGNHYPKLYLPDDLKAYAAQWQCTEWEDVYQKKNEEDLTLTATTVLTPPLADDKENLNEAISEIQTKIMAQLASFNQAMDDRFQKHTQILTAQANTMMSTLTTNTKVLNEKDEKTEVLSAQAVALTRKIDELETKTETLTTNAPHLTNQVEMLTTTVKEIMTKLDDIKAQIEKNITEDENTKTGNSDDVEAIASDIEKKTTSHIEKIAINQIRLGNGFYKNVNTQSKQSFDLARFLVLIGAGIFVVSIIAFIIPFSTGNTTVVGSVGIITSCIIETIGGLSFLYNKASVQFAHFHLFLDRINRASIAHAMCDNIKDENRKQEQLILVVQELLRDDERIKG
jgi:hypothetical protein